MQQKLLLLLAAVGLVMVCQCKAYDYRHEPLPSANSADLYQLARMLLRNAQALDEQTDKQYRDTTPCDRTYCATYCHCTSHSVAGCAAYVATSNGLTGTVDPVVIRGRCINGYGPVSGGCC